MAERGPSVSVVMPVLNEAAMLPACLESIVAQDYPYLEEIVIADGGSTDATREIADRYEKVKVVDNPRRNRPAGLNVAIAHANGEVIVRVDARTRLAPDYVRRCVEALERSHAAIVGGPMRFSCENAKQRGIAAAMMSRLGAGPAEFRRLGGEPRFVDTVYLGTFRKDVVTALGGYNEWSGGNEDAELAYRAQAVSGVYLDPAIRSRYAVRDRLWELARQFHRYGRNRALTLRMHPRSLSVRQLAVPALFVGLAVPTSRRSVALSYTTLVLGRAVGLVLSDPAAAPTFVLAVPTMHLAWGSGLVVGLCRGQTRRTFLLHG